MSSSPGSSQEFCSPRSSPEHDEDGTEQSFAEEEEQGDTPTASSPIPDDLDSPDLIPPQEMAEALANAVGTYVRPRQPNTPLPTPGHHEIDDQDAEQQAWNAVFQDSEGSEDVLAAVQDYLNVAGVNDFLVRIAQIHEEDEFVTRQRFARRYLDDLPWRDENGLDILDNQASMLHRMLMDEVDLSYRTQEEILRRWRSLVTRVIAPATGAMRRTLARTDVLRDLEDFIALYGWDETIRSFRLTHGNHPNYRATIGVFFYRDLTTNVEETLMPAERSTRVRSRITNGGRIETVETRTPLRDESQTAARELVTWIHDHAAPMLPAGEVWARVRDSDQERVIARLGQGVGDEFSEDDEDMTEADSWQLVQDALQPRYDADFRWGRLYLRVLRYIELFGAEAAVDAVSGYIPAHIRPLLSREGADAVLQLGYMRTGDSALAALIADWLADTRRDRLPPVLREAPRVRRRVPAPTPAEDTVSRRSRDRLRRRHDAEMDEMNVRMVKRDVALDEREEELAEVREQAEEARQEAQILRIERDALRDDLQDIAQGRQQPPRSRAPQPRDDTDSEDELAGPSPLPRPHGHRPLRPDDFDENYDVTPPRSTQGQRKRRRSSNPDGEVLRATPPGRRRRVVDHVLIPVAAAATGSRVTRSMARSGKGTVEDGLQ